MNKILCCFSFFYGIGRVWNLNLRQHHRLHHWASGLAGHILRRRYVVHAPTAASDCSCLPIIQVFVFLLTGHWCSDGACVPWGNAGPMAVDGGWSVWPTAAECSTSCILSGSGVKVFERSCTNPTPANGGRSCEVRYRFFSSSFMLKLTKQFYRQSINRSIK